MLVLTQYLKLMKFQTIQSKDIRLMTKDMPSRGRLSLDMMYRTCGTQLNIDYESEKISLKNLKLLIQ